MRSLCAFTYALTASFLAGSGCATVPGIAVPDVPASLRPPAGHVVYLEALASGLPVVATEVPGYMSVLEPGRDSVTVPPKNWRELAASLVILARDPELRARLADYAMQKAARYSWKNVAAEVVEVYLDARKALAREPIPALEVSSVHHAV